MPDNDDLVQHERRVIWEERCTFLSAQIRKRFNKQCEANPDFVHMAAGALGYPSSALQAWVESGIIYRVPMDAVGHLMILVGMSPPKE